jgi:hypothetical protein
VWTAFVKGDRNYGLATVLSRNFELATNERCTSRARTMRGVFPEAFTGHGEVARR